MRTQSLKLNRGAEKSIPNLERVLLILLVCCVQMIYIPTSNQMVGGIEPKLPIDVFPIIPVWVLPYVLCYPFWLIEIFWATFKLEEGLFRAFIAALLLIATFSIATFIFFPTYIKAASFNGRDIFTNLLRYIHENLGRYDAFPSGHVYITTALALFYSRWYPHLKNLWKSSVVIVALSTLFTGQHYFTDVIGGLVVAFTGYYFGLKWAGIPGVESKAAEGKLTRPPSR